MAVASYKELCLDAVDHHAMAAFWAAVLGLEVVETDDDVARLVGETPRHTLWINRVPEPVTVKQRVHLDVNVLAVHDALVLGATAADLETWRWKILRDPEGGELCVFERGELAAYRLYEVVVDALDAVAMATWWADVLGATVEHEESCSSVEAIPGAPFSALVFQSVPEPKTVKNRIHWDLTVPECEALLAAGATVVRRRDEEIRWTVMADPEGNEFCAFGAA